MKKATALLAALLVITPAVSGSAVAGERLKYSTTVSGIPLGSAKITVDGTAPDYTVRASFKMIPILRQILNGDAEARADGQIVGGRHLPRQSVFRYEDRGGDKRTTITFDAAGIPVDLDAKPPIKPRSYRMTLGEAAGAVDPATAAAVLMAPRVQPCRLSFDVFDGKKRHRISLTGQQAATQGGVVTCAGLYERVNGFKDKYMTPERRTWPFVAQLIRRGGSWVPLKITADTKFGPASVKLKR